MAKTDALARVAADLARGHTQPAIQRLSSLVAVHPTDLDLRLRLAAVHRMVGNRIEAGRWGYLDPSTDPAETAAFEAAFPGGMRRLSALRWPLRSAQAATEYARGRLDVLAAAAKAECGTTADGAERVDIGTPFGALALFVAIVAAVVFAVIGAITAAQWLM